MQYQVRRLRAQPARHGRSPLLQIHGWLGRASRACGGDGHSSRACGSLALPTQLYKICEPNPPAMARRKLTPLKTGPRSTPDQRGRPSRSKSDNEEVGGGSTDMSVACPGWKPRRGVHHNVAIGRAKPLRAWKRRRYAMTLSNWIATAADGTGSLHQGIELQTETFSLGPERARAGIDWSTSCGPWPPWSTRWIRTPSSSRLRPRRR